MTEAHVALKSRVAEIAADGNLGEAAHRAWQDGTIVLVLDDDLDWTNPAFPFAPAETLRSLGDDDVWQALTDTQPGSVNIAVYPVMPGGRVALVLAKQHPRNGEFPESAIAVSGAADGQAVVVRSVAKASYRSPAFTLPGVRRPALIGHDSDVAAHLRP